MIENAGLDFWESWCPLMKLLWYFFFSPYAFCLEKKWSVLCLWSTAPPLPTFLSFLWIKRKTAKPDQRSHRLILNRSAKCWAQSLLREYGGRFNPLRNFSDRQPVHTNGRVLLPVFLGVTFVEFPASESCPFHLHLPQRWLWLDLGRCAKCSGIAD